MKKNNRMKNLLSTIKVKYMKETYPINTKDYIDKQTLEAHISTITNELIESITKEKALKENEINDLSNDIKEVVTARIVIE